MDIVSWGRKTKGGKREDQIKAAFRRAGCAVDEPDDPFYLDQPLEKQPARLDIRHMPELENAVHSLADKGQLVVITLGHFGVPRVWAWVAQNLARKAASIRDLESGKTWDFAVDPGAGYEIERLVESMSNRLRTVNARVARIESGRLGPKEKLADPALRKRAARLWADPEKTKAMVAEEIGVSVMTLHRHLGPKTEAERKAKKDAK